MKLLTAILFACVATLALLHSVYGTPLPTPVAEAAPETAPAPAPSPVPLAVSEPKVEVGPLSNGSLSNLADAATAPVANDDAGFVALSANADPKPISPAAAEPVAVQLDDESPTLDDIVPDAPVNPAQS